MARSHWGFHEYHKPVRVPRRVSSSRRLVQRPFIIATPSPAESSVSWPCRALNVSSHAIFQTLLLLLLLLKSVWFSLTSQHLFLSRVFGVMKAEFKSALLEEATVQGRRESRGRAWEHRCCVCGQVLCL